MQFHIVSFEGPDAYARAGGLATRVESLAGALARHGFETHLWFIGDPDASGYEIVDGVHLHRWCQWLSRGLPYGVYHGEEIKRVEFATTLPPHLFQAVAPALGRGEHVVVLAEEWQTADAVLHLDWLLRSAELRARATLLWNANNGFGFERIDWDRLAGAAAVTTVSRYMKHLMRPLGVNPIVVPNGLGPEAFGEPTQDAVATFQARVRGRTVLAKIARFDPSKRWIDTIRAVAQMKQLGWRPLLLARGGAEAHGEEVRRAAAEAGMRCEARRLPAPGELGLLGMLDGGLDDVDFIEIRSHIDPDARRLLLRSAAVVLANSSHEPFGLVGLEAMAVGGLACTGSSGEDYAMAGRNALVLETDETHELIDLYRPLRDAPQRVISLRDAGRRTAEAYAWSEVLGRVLLPRIEIETHRTARRPTRGRSRSRPSAPPA